MRALRLSLRSVFAGLMVVVAALAASGCGGGVNRPEGPAERYLSSISRGTDADAIARFGEIEAASDVLGFEIDGLAEANQKNLDRHEIGPAVVDGDTAVVPVQVWRSGSDTPVAMALQMQLSDGMWRVTGTEPLTTEIAFPSGGGNTYGMTSGQLVLVCIATLLVTFVVALTIVRLSGARPMHKRPELHHHPED